MLLQIFDRSGKNRLRVCFSHNCYITTQRRKMFTLQVDSWLSNTLLT